MSKKIFAVVLSLVMLFALAMPAFAADAKIVTAASATTVKRGETFTVTLAFDGTVNFKTFGFNFKNAFSADAFKVSKGAWNSGLKEAQVFPDDHPEKPGEEEQVMAPVTLSSGDAGFASEIERQATGVFFTFTVKVLDNAKFGSYPVLIEVADGAEVKPEVVPVTITVTHDCVLDTNYSKDADGHWYACTVEGCNVPPTKVPHTWTGCEETCPACGQTRTVTHDYATAKFDNDNHWNECACGAKDAVAAHSFEEVVADKFLKDAATCTSPAKYYKSCACGAVSTETFENGPMAEHTWDSTCDEACNVCGFERVGTHTYDQTKSDADNHWNECLCGKKDDASVAAHAFKEVVDPQFLAAKANCQSPAKYYKTCDCGAKSTETFEDGEKDANVHANTEVKDAKPADCKTEGYTGDTYCVDENKKIADGTKIEKTAHTFGEWVVTKEATKEEEGSKERTCTVCKTEKETAKIDKLPASTGVATGDTFNAVLWTVLSFTSVAVLAAVVYFKKREGNRA